MPDDNLTYTMHLNQWLKERFGSPEEALVFLVKFVKEMVEEAPVEVLDRVFPDAKRD